jgi:anti-sigma B factor antagonist
VDVRLSRSGSILIARPASRWLDEQTAPDLWSTVAGEIEDGERFIVLDLSEVVNVDSAGLGMMVRLLKRTPEGGRLVLGGCPQAVRQLLEKTRLDRVLVAYATAAEAVASFGAKD